MEILVQVVQVRVRTSRMGGAREEAARRRLCINTASCITVLSAAAALSYGNWKILYHLSVSFMRYLLIIIVVFVMYSFCIRFVFVSYVFVLFLVYSLCICYCSLHFHIFIIRYVFVIYS